MDKVLLALGIGFVFWCIGDAIVRIIRAGKGGTGGTQLKDRIDDLEADLDDACKRIEVLEKIVTDGREDLRREIDGLG